MAGVILNGNVSGSVSLQPPDAAGSNVINVPAATGTMMVNSNASNILAEAQGGTGTTTGYYGFKNRIINGAMVIDQRNAGASFTPVDNAYGLDRYKYSLSQASKLTAQQSSTTPTGAGFSYLHTVGASANVTVGSSDIFAFSQPVEGFNTADLNFGTASASTVTLSFLVRSSVTGTFSVALLNGAANRSYVATYTVNSANTWEQKSITVTGDNNGTWIGATNGLGLRVYFDLGAGSTYTTSAGSWQAGAFTHATGSTNLIATNEATFYITGVQLEKGSTATSFDYRPYGTELALCQRYLPSTSTATNGGTYAGQVFSNTAAICVLSLPVPARVAPTGITTTGTFSCITAAGGAANAATLAFNRAGEQSAMVVASTTGMTIGNATILLCDNGRILFTGCEL